MGSGMAQIFFPDVLSLEENIPGAGLVLGSKHAAVISISPEVAGLLSDSGYNPSDFNKMTWPNIGAASYASGTFLISRTTLDHLISLQDQTIDPEEEAEEGKGEGEGEGDRALGDTPGPITDPGVIVESDAKPLRMVFQDTMGVIEFDKLYMINVTPLISKKKKAAIPYEYDFYIVDLVDERYWWQSHPIIDSYKLGDETIDGIFKHGLNLVNRNELTEYLKPSLFDPDPEADAVPWTALDVLNVMLDRGGAWGEFGGKAEFPFLDESEWKYSSDQADYPDFDIIDYHATGRPLGEFLDSILTMSGLVVVANHISQPGAGGKSYRYEIRPIEDQLETAASWWTNPGDPTNTWETAIISGGRLPSFPPLCPACYGTGDGDQGLGTGEDFIYPLEAIRNEVPFKVIVMLPKSTGGGDDPETDRWVSLQTNNGRPDVFSGNRKFTIYGHLHARFTFTPGVGGDEGELTWDNEDDCKTYADRMAMRYYDRFRSSPVNHLYQGWVSSQGFNWAGLQEITWSLTSQGSTTQWSGNYHHPLFGFQTDEQLYQGDVTTAAGARVLPRVGGGVLIESPGGDEVTLHQAVITGWENGNPVYNAKYGAVSVSDPLLHITSAIQPIRPHSTSFVNCQPLDLGDPCVIGVVPEAWVSDNHPVISLTNGSRGLSSDRFPGLLTGYGAFNGPPGERGLEDPGTVFEYFQTEDGRYCVLYVFEIPSTVRCEFINPPLAARSQDGETFYTRSNLYGY